MRVHFSVHREEKCTQRGSPSCFQAATFIGFTALCFSCPVVFAGRVGKNLDKQGIKSDKIMQIHGRLKGVNGYGVRKEMWNHQEDDEKTYQEINEEVKK
jgi:hypothetical protein